MALEKNIAAAPASTESEALAAAMSPAWTFLSTHAQVLLSIARRPDVRMREVAEDLRVTERAVQRIVKDLEQAGYLTRTKIGRRNRYQIHIDRPMRHALVGHRQVRDLLDLIGTVAPPSDSS